VNACQRRRWRRAVRNLLARPRPKSGGKGDGCESRSEEDRGKADCGPEDNGEEDLCEENVREVDAKTTASSPTKKSRGHRYSPEASKSVEREMKEMHEGKLTIGRSGKKVTNPKQAIAIGLSEARGAGKKVPPNPNE